MSATFYCQMSFATFHRGASIYDRLEDARICTWNSWLDSLTPTALLFLVTDPLSDNLIRENHISRVPEGMSSTLRPWFSLLSRLYLWVRISTRNDEMGESGKSSFTTNVTCDCKLDVIPVHIRHRKIYRTCSEVSILINAVKDRLQRKEVCVKRNISLSSTSF